jgi:exoribonuclease R
MLPLSKHNWISGTLELSSKVRYGMTTRGVPIFRFIPYDKRFLPLAVGCSQRELFYNVHAIVEPSEPKKEGQLQRANLVKNLGKPTNKTEIEVILVAYAYDSLKEQKAFPQYEGFPLQIYTPRPTLEGFTFHIDPPGCKDVDDTFTIKQDTTFPNFWNIAINIADVSELVQEGSSLDSAARKRATSFYTPQGEAIYPMIPKEISEEKASLLPAAEEEAKPTLSLCLTYDTITQEISKPSWKLTYTQTTASYTYDEANSRANQRQELKILQACASKIAGLKLIDSHAWVERMMIFYNQQAGQLLAEHRTGILRRHAESSLPLVTSIKGMSDIPEFLFYESAEYCLSTDPSTRHYGLGSEFYAYASSPIRRYADLVNQRAIKDILQGTTSPILNQDLIDELNRRQKQAKAFSRDLFFMTNLTLPSKEPVKGIVISQNPEQTKTKIWVPQWKRKITSRNLVANPLTQGTEVMIQWYELREEARWKDRIVFKLNVNNTPE